MAKTKPLPQFSFDPGMVWVLIHATISASERNPETAKKAARALANAAKAYRLAKIAATPASALPSTAFTEQDIDEMTDLVPSANQDKSYIAAQSPAPRRYPTEEL